jgi:hypothetical protein
MELHDPAAVDRYREALAALRDDPRRTAVLVELAHQLPTAGYYDAAVEIGSSTRRRPRGCARGWTS